MIFPLVPVPEFLVVWIPSIFAPSQHLMVATIGGILGLVSGIGHILPPLEEGKNDETSKQFMISGIVMLICSLLFFVFGGYFLFLLIVATIVAAVIWLRKRMKKILK